MGADDGPTYLTSFDLHPDSENLFAVVAGWSTAQTINPLEDQGNIIVDDYGITPVDPGFSFIQVISSGQTEGYS